MRWHLCSPLGTSERTTEAETEFWAKRRFAPIPNGWFVASDASYRLGWREVKPELLDICSKCNRHPAVEGRNLCPSCAHHKRTSYRKQHGLDPLAPVRERTERRKEPRDMTLRSGEGLDLMTTARAARRLGVSTNSVHAIMKGHGYDPIAEFAPRIGSAGRGERQWVVTEVKHVQAIRNSQRSKSVNVARGIRFRAEKRQQLTLSL